MITPQKFVLYLKNSTLDIRDQDAILNLIPHLTLEEIDDIGNILKTDSEKLQTCFQNADQLYQELVASMPVNE